MLSRFPHWRDWHIATKLAILIVVVTIVPLLFVTLYNAISARADFIAAARSQNLQRARTTAQALDDSLESHLADIRFIATLPDTVQFLTNISEADALTESNIILRQMSETHKYDALYLTDPSGTVIIASDARFVGRNYVAARWFQNAIVGQESFDEPRYDAQDNQVYLHFSAPVRDAQGTTLGTAISRITLAEIDRLIVADTDFAGSDEFGVLWDDQGIRLSHGTRPDLRFKPFAPLSPQVADALIVEQRYGPATENLLKDASYISEIIERTRMLLYDSQADPFVHFTSVAAVPGDAALVPLKNKRWVYGVFTPEESLVVGLNAQTQRSLIIAIMAGLLAMVAALAGSRWVTRPIRVVAQAANALAAGDMTSRVQLKQRDEVGQLAAAFDTMAGVLEQKQAQLNSYTTGLEQRVQERTRQVTAASQMGHDLAETLNLTALYERLAQVTGELLPDTCTVFVSLFNAERKLMACVYGIQDGAPVNVADLPPILLEPPGVGTQSEAIHTRQPLIVNDLGERLNHVQTVVQVGTPGLTTQSGLYVPMLAKDKVIGVVQAQSYTPNRFTPADAELLCLVANIAAVSFENARMFEEINCQLGRVQAMRSIDMAITSSFDLRLTLQVVLEQVTTQLHFDAADIWVFNAQALTLENLVWRGFRSKEVERKRLRLGEGLTGRVILERRTIAISDFGLETSGTSPVSKSRSALPGLSTEGFVAYFGVPLIAKGEVKGVLQIYHRTPAHPDPESLEFIEMTARQAAIAIDNSKLFNDLQHSNVELALAYDTTLEGWSRALDLRDKETEGHTQRVTEMAVRLAQAMGMSEADLVHVRRGALLHDIGKMGVPDGILLKPDALTAEEWTIMRRHPEYALELLSPISYLHHALDVPYCHHEKWDGTGYPRGLRGEQIPLAARIFAIADVWDALISNRPYRDGWAKDRARKHIAEGSGAHFDPKVVNVFLSLIAQE